jgi:N-acetylmuramoyl-L-alanine amidase
MSRRVDFQPDSKLAKVVYSPNHDERKRGAQADMIVLHYTGMSSAEDALKRLCDPTSKVSSHYLVYEDGAIVQLVPEARRAWHAGQSTWKGARDINGRSVGIEIANPGHDVGYPDFSEQQIEAVIALCRDVIARLPILPDHVLAHSDVAPARKNDPGEKFPWRRFFEHGVGLWVEPRPVRPGPKLKGGDRAEAVSHLQRELATFGYGLSITGQYDAATRQVVTAFQRHFRPTLVDGVADVSTIETLQALLARRNDLRS